MYAMVATAPSLPFTLLFTFPTPPHTCGTATPHQKDHPPSYRLPLHIRGVCQHTRTARVPLFALPPGVRYSTIVFILTFNLHGLLTGWLTPHLQHRPHRIVNYTLPSPHSLFVALPGTGLFVHAPPARHTRAHSQGTPARHATLRSHPVPPHTHTTTPHLCCSHALPTTCLCCICCTYLAMLPDAFVQLMPSSSFSTCRHLVPGGTITCTQCPMHPLGFCLYGFCIRLRSSLAGPLHPHRGHHAAHCQRVSLVACLTWFP